MIIEAQFNGPAGSANGGYTAGLVAGRLAPPPGAVPQVTLREPPPLETPLRVAPADGGGLSVYAGERLVAEAVTAPPGTVALGSEAPPPVSYEEATAAATAYPGLTDHPFPTCYVCGPDRPAGDGLRIFPGPRPDGPGTAAPWRVPAGASAVTVWAALDCPGGWAIIEAGRPYVLGRIAAEVRAVPPDGAACVVVGAVCAVEGRKAQVRSALYQTGEAGPRLLAWAIVTWISI